MRAPLLAMVFDFDRTLSPFYMQKPLFERLGVDEAEWWSSVTADKATARQQGLRVLDETFYLTKIVQEAQPGGMLDGLNRDLLRKAGQEIELFPGIPDFFDAMSDHVQNSPEGQALGVRLEHYIVSAGLREMLQNNVVANHVRQFLASEFTYDAKGVPNGIAYPVSNAEKQAEIFRINKGAYDQPNVNENTSLPDHLRRIPLENMIYFGDGPSDVPAMKIIQLHGGSNIAVYDANTPFSKEQKQPGKNAFALLDQGRVNHALPADYRKGTALYFAAVHELDKSLNRIANRWHRDIRQASGHAPRNVME